MDTDNQLCVNQKNEKTENKFPADYILQEVATPER